MMKLKALTAAVLVTLSAGAFAASVNPFPYKILEDGVTAGLTVGKFGNSDVGGVTWTFLTDFDLKLSVFGTGTSKYSYSLTSGGVADTGTFSSLGSSSFSGGRTWLYDVDPWENSRLSAGTYTFTYDARVLKGGTAGISLYASVPTAPVPEPETYAMLLAGLGLMGAIAKRRKDKQA
jgi:hypothetical protein